MTKERRAELVHTFVPRLTDALREAVKIVDNLPAHDVMLSEWRELLSVADEMIDGKIKPMNTTRVSSGFKYSDDAAWVLFQDGTYFQGHVTNYPS